MAFFVRKAGRLYTARTVAPLHGPGSLGCHATFAVTPRSTSAWQGRTHLKTHTVAARKNILLRRSLPHYLQRRKTTLRQGRP